VLEPKVHTRPHHQPRERDDHRPRDDRLNHPGDDLLDPHPLDADRRQQAVFDLARVLELGD
jgi:hypothetical protein